MRNRASPHRSASPRSSQFSSDVSFNDSSGPPAIDCQRLGMTSPGDDHAHGTQHADKSDRQYGECKVVRSVLDPSNHVTEEERGQGSKGVDLSQPGGSHFWAKQL